MSYTTTEKAAIVAVFTELLNSNPNRTFEENVFLLEFMKTQNIGIETYSLGEEWTIQQAIPIIKNMSEEKRQVFFSNVQQLISIRGHNDNMMIQVWGDFIIACGYENQIELQFRNFTAKSGINNYEAKIYLTSVKMNLKQRDADFVKEWDDIARIWQEQFCNIPLTFEEICQIVVNNSRYNVKEMNWDEYDKDGVAWFIGNFSEVVVKARLATSFDTVFLESWELYFKK